MSLVSKSARLKSCAGLFDQIDVICPQKFLIQHKKEKPVLSFSFLRAPGMVDNLVVKVHYGLGSRNR